MIRSSKATTTSNGPNKHHSRSKRRNDDSSVLELIERLLLPGVAFFFIGTLSIFYVLTSTAPPSEGSVLQRKKSILGVLKKKKKYSQRPDEMPDVGDKREKYRALRDEFDGIYPMDGVEAHREIVESLHKRKYEPMERDIGYDIYNCPLHPPDGYPFTFNIVSDILKNWPADDTTPRPKIYMTLCIFDHETDLSKAENYRTAELPFIVRNDPRVLRTAARWSHPHYLKRLLAGEKHRTEYSPNNHFMYWNAPNAPKKKHRTSLRLGSKVIPAGWEAPTKLIYMTYEKWLSHADTRDERKLGPDHPHWYFRLIGCGKGLEESGCDNNNSESLFDELPFFQPKKSLYIVHPTKQKGIHCRFGMKGTIAENHFDGSRNFIVLLGGERRYILAHPEECPRLALLPKEHPSGRHSAVDWSEPDLEEYPQFKEARGNEVVMQAGDVLYLPTHWFHYIISLELNYQCNTRSGYADEYKDIIRDCGF